eukprot:7391087-Prymnesium_polylepis.1
MPPVDAFLRSHKRASCRPVSVAAKVALIGRWTASSDMGISLHWCPSKSACGAATKDAQSSAAQRAIDGWEGRVTCGAGPQSRNVSHTLFLHYHGTKYLGEY